MLSVNTGRYRDGTEIERNEGRRSDNGRISHMAVINAPEVLDNSMKRRFLARVGVQCCVRDVVFWRVAATDDSTVYEYEITIIIMGAKTQTEATKSPQLK